MNSGNRAFSQILLQAIDESLLVLGEQPKEAVYQYLMTMHSVRREEIPDRLGDFTRGMKKALGGASSVIERLILKKLFQGVGSSFKDAQGLDFADYVNDAKRRFEMIGQMRFGRSEYLDSGRSKKGQVSS